MEEIVVVPKSRLRSGSRVVLLLAMRRVFLRMSEEEFLIEDDIDLESQLSLDGVSKALQR